MSSLRACRQAWPDAPRESHSGDRYRLQVRPMRGDRLSVCADGSCRHWLRAAPGKAGIRNRVRCVRGNRPPSLRTVPEITHVRTHGELFAGPASAGRFRARPPILTPHGDAARPASGPARAREKTLRMALRDNPGSRPPNGSTGPHNQTLPTHPCNRLHNQHLRVHPTVAKQPRALPIRCWKDGPILDADFPRNGSILHAAQQTRSSHGGACTARRTGEAQVKSVFCDPGSTAGWRSNSCLGCCAQELCTYP